jgi:23S rRNA (uracil1939-C5)-methyltransferase
VKETVVRIEKLAPTGEGVARTSSGVGFVEGALPGELVATNVYQVKRNFWRGRVSVVREPSDDRIEGDHADCAGCDWAFFEPSVARRTKQELFRETMQRLGRLDAATFGELPIEASPPGYRLRARLHVSGSAVGYFSPGTHRVVSAGDCEALAPALRARLPVVERALRESGLEASEVALLENVDGSKRVCRLRIEGSSADGADLAARLSGFDGVRVIGASGTTLHETGPAALDLAVGDRVFRVSVGSFFQANRYLVGPLRAAVAREARRVPAGLALDVFGGVGLFAGVLLDAGHRVVSVEGDPGAAADARATFSRWDDGAACEAVEGSVEEFLRRDDRRFSCVVADPPRAGLGRELARALAGRAEKALVYVSCDPATLARDLPVILEEGFTVRSATLFDLFAFTHRVEAMVALERAA